MKFRIQHVIIAGVVLVAGGIAVVTRPVPTEAAATATRATLEVTAVVRDVKAYNEDGGHPDFQRWTGRVRLGMVEPRLGADGKPVLRDRSGFELTSPFRDDAGRPVNPFLQAINDAADDDEESDIYDPANLLDVVGAFDGSTTGVLLDVDAPRVTSVESFNQWYRDVPGVNISTTIPLILEETEPGSGRFVFDSHGAATKALNPWLADLPIEGFFPINDRGFGNFAGHDGGSSNFHFTTEVVTTFTYLEGADYTFGFSGDDDLWVFIGGHLVIDLGGLHSREEQWVDLDDLEWLEDGEDYAMHIFHAERRTNQSNFRIETTIPMRPLGSVTTFDAYD